MERKMLSAPPTLTSYQPFSAASPVKSEIKNEIIPDSPPPKAIPTSTTKFSVLAYTILF